MSAQGAKSATSMTGYMFCLAIMTPPRCWDGRLFGSGSGVRPDRARGAGGNFPT